MAEQVKAQPQERFLEVHGTRVQLVEAGSGPPLVYLHGAGSAGAWTPFHELLAERYHLYAPSHPGFGVSADLPGLSSVADFALHYLDLLDQLGLEGTALAGSSLGGWIAAELCVWQPARISKLVLIDAAGLDLPGLHQPDMFAADQAQSAELMYADPTLAPEPDYTPEALERRLRDRATLARVGWNPYLHDPALPRRLYRLTMPTLLLWGEDDRLIPPAIAERWRELLPDARVHLIPNCGHSSHREQPTALARATIEFLEG